MNHQVEREIFDLNNLQQRLFEIKWADCLVVIKLLVNTAKLPLTQASSFDDSLLESIQSERGANIYRLFNLKSILALLLKFCAITNF